MGDNVLEQRFSVETRLHIYSFIGNLDLMRMFFSNGDAIIAEILLNRYKKNCPAKILSKLLDRKTSALVVPSADIGIICARIDSQLLYTCVILTCQFQRECAKRFVKETVRLFKKYIFVLQISF